MWTCPTLTLLRKRKRKRGKLDVKQLQLDKGLTDDHGSELEALPDALPMNLVRKVGESDVTH